MGGADLDAEPICFRAAFALKYLFYDARSIFTDAFDKRTHSGQNGPDKFMEFLSRDGTNLLRQFQSPLIAALLGTM